MITRNWTYNGVSLSDSLSKTQKVAVQEVKHSIVLDTPTRELARGGTLTGSTIPRGRLFSFSGVIFGATEAERATGQAVLNSLIIPGVAKTLTWSDDTGGPYTVQGKVFKMPEYTHEMASPVMEFEFEIFADDAGYYGTSKSQTGSLGTVGGITLPQVLPFILGGYTNGITCNNAGDYTAYPTIVIDGAASNVKVFNVTTGQVYRLNTNTNKITMNSLALTITDTDVYGVQTDISGFRGVRSIFPTLQPGNNVFVVTADSGNPAITISWRDTFIHSGI